jgi:hypothetical protein
MCLSPFLPLGALLFMLAPRGFLAIGTAIRVDFTGTAALPFHSGTQSPFFILDRLFGFHAFRTMLRAIRPLLRISTRFRACRKVGSVIVGRDIGVAILDAVERLDPFVVVVLFAGFLESGAKRSDPETADV